MFYFYVLYNSFMVLGFLAYLKRPLQSKIIFKILRFEILCNDFFAFSSFLVFNFFINLDLVLVEGMW